MDEQTVDSIEFDTVEQGEDILTLALADGREDDVTIVEARLAELKSSGREVLADNFVSPVRIIDRYNDGTIKFTAIVAQADKINKNGRLYPKEEFEKNLRRVNAACKKGRMKGKNGHDGWFSSSPPTNTCVRWDKVFIEGEDLYMEGTLIPTQAGIEIATLWDHGIETEWSIVGYGKPEQKTDEKGKEYTEIRDYILDGCDVVDRGAADTKTVSIDLNSANHEEATQMAEETTHVQDAVVEKPVAAAGVSAVPPIDVDSIAKKASEEAVLAAKQAAQEMATSIVDAARKQAILDAAKSSAIDKIAEKDEKLAKLVAKHFDGCETPEEIAAVVEEITPMIEGLKQPKQFEGPGIHIGNEREKYMALSTGQVIDRPTTIEGVRAALLEGLPEKREGDRLVKQDGTNLKWVMNKLIDNYKNSRDEQKYLYACTRQGFAETASTSSVLSTMLPAVLPIIRQVLPQLIPYEIASVVPIDRPSARVYFYDPLYNSGASDGSTIDDSTAFSSSWADHTEGDTKSQIEPNFNYVDLTAVEKSIHWDLTSVLIQDMQNVYNMDAEQLMLSTAADQIAREINMMFLELMAAGASAQAVTFGVTKPSSIDSQEKWLDWGLTQVVNSQAKNIFKGMYLPPDWIVCGPTQAALFVGTNKFEAFPAGPSNEFGFGLKRSGVWNGQYTIYVAAWAETLTSLKNKMLMGYRPPQWMYTAAVYAPYIPIYISPVDASASKNTIARSASSRFAMRVLQGKGLGALTVSDGTGNVPDYTD